ncbi:MAG: AAA family ATPase [Spirochaetia bacterium]|nr:AAA family ATPase [Spirochaetia bacterium]
MMKKALTAREQVNEIAAFREKTVKAAENYLIGFESIIDEILTAFLAGGHVLLIGVPGLGKTLLVKTLSHLWGLSFSRIQFTPDLLPSDITGTEILQENIDKNKRLIREFEFQKGPVFANLVLADEINRTPPKTQSALLQAMEEKEVTVGRRTLKIEEPFMVMATQNPIEMEGTYPLPEAQLDRFFISLNLQYPEHEKEKEIALISYNNQKTLDKLKTVDNAKKILKYRELIDSVMIPDSVLEKMITSVRNTRPSSGHPYAARFGEYGAGPRAAQYLVRAARARALILGETLVTEEIFEMVYYNVLRHRIILNYAALSEKISVDEYLADCLIS